MKKVIHAILAGLLLCAAFAGCSAAGEDATQSALEELSSRLDVLSQRVEDLESAQAQQLTPAPEEETSAVEEEPSSAAGEEPAAAVAVNQVLVDESGIKITYTGMEMTEEGNAELKMTVENNSEQPILVNVQDFSANGMMMNAMFATQVTPGKKSNDELTIYASTLEENGVTAVESVEFSLVVFNDDTLDTIVETDLIALTV